MKRKSLFDDSGNAGPSEKRSKEQAVTRATSLGLPGKATSSRLVIKTRVSRRRSLPALKATHCDEPINGASTVESASTVQGASTVESSPPTQRERASQCDQPTQREQGTQSVRRKRKTCFRDLDSEDFQAAKKICISLAPSSKYSWKLPLTKLWGICRKIFGGLKQKVFGKVPDPASFSAQYYVGRVLGTGGFGSVHDGTRKRDGKNVALKFIRKGDHEKYLTFPGTSLKLPLEVGLQLMVSRPPACDHIVELLDWFDEPDYIIIVMEHPFPCMDLIGVMRHITCGAMREDYARRIWQQAVLACRQCRDRGVLHRDVKAENLLLQLDTFRVKLVDFGCSDLFQEELYSEYLGTLLYCPPEVFIEGTYGGDKATVWSLGVLLYAMVNANLPFRDAEEICSGDDFPFITGLSDECRDLIKWCLRQNANRRPSFEDILQHEWFQGPQH
ncbi:hypothetical protein DPEC_G00226320 [Dallia pectoralis]|uniref:Uncharacterized protein n=1 Tax=Dallia pectoralis TaxID=75939 RepID=A0ACC2G0N6_DALPE|nr:hypothetical protein DPEC_G00226320 [Dallia pectoralis]